MVTNTEVWTSIGVKKTTKRELAKVKKMLMVNSYEDMFVLAMDNLRIMGLKNLAFVADYILEGPRRAEVLRAINEDLGYEFMSPQPTTED